MRAGSEDELCIRLYFRPAQQLIRRPGRTLESAAYSNPRQRVCPAQGLPPASGVSRDSSALRYILCSYRRVGSGSHSFEALLPSPHSFAQSSREHRAPTPLLQGLHPPPAAFPPFSDGSQWRNGPHWNRHNENMCPTHGSS